MSDTSSQSRIRVALAQFCMGRGIDLEQLYSSLGADMTSADSEALSHMAGVFDGMALAEQRIRERGIDSWAKSD